jgi:3-phosphoshikimate 1-carboxyvinyltransferase
MSLTVTAIDGLRGELTVPGDKSISHRALMLGAIAAGDTTIKNFLNTGDCLSTAGVLAKLGVRIDGIGGDVVVVHGRGRRGLKQPTSVLDAGNSATTARLMTGLLAGQDFSSVITGDDSLRTRPMGRVVEPLKKMGAKIKGKERGNKLPLTVTGNNLKGITYNTPVASAQIKSALLLAGLYAAGQTTVAEPYPSRDHTERMLEVMGAHVKISDEGVTVTGANELKSTAIDVPGDISSAAFFIVAALVTPSSAITIRQVGMNTGRIGLLDVLKDMGAGITYGSMTMKNKEPRADIIVTSRALRGAVVKAATVPRLVDEIPILAVAATQATGKTVIKGAAELRVKESDRLSAITANLRAMGAKIRETEDGLVITGPTPLKGAPVKTHGDHRMAMAMIVAGLIAEGETVIDDDTCINVSFPGFERMLTSVAI